MQHFLYFFPLPQGQGSLRFRRLPGLTIGLGLPQAASPKGAFSAPAEGPSIRPPPSRPCVSRSAKNAPQSEGTSPLTDAGRLSLATGPNKDDFTSYSSTSSGSTSRCSQA